MGLVVPESIENIVITDLLTPALTLRIYGNNITPSNTDTTALYNEIAGGGYASLPLTFANWVISGGDPTTAAYPTQQWTFSDVINSPGTIYGYYVTRNSDNQLMWAERFPSGTVPFSPVNGSIIKILIKFTTQSEY